jgi:hypothetical protein
MYQEIVALETAFNKLLPARKLDPVPGKALLEAAAAWSEKVLAFSSLRGPATLTGKQIGEGSRLARSPLFICGVHRSGTTLLRNLLDGHPALTVLPSEGSFLSNFAAQLRAIPEKEREAYLLVRWLRRMANPVNQPPYWSLGRSTATASPYLDFARTFSAWYRFAAENLSGISIWPHLAPVLAYASCSREPDGGLAARYWVDKTPVQEKYVRQIRQQLPEARFIQMIRAPADVLLSRKRMEPSLPLSTCLRDMRLSYQKAIEESVRHKDSHLVVHYESLCSDPVTAMSRITGFLGIGMHPALFTPTVAGEPAHANSSFSAGLPAGTILDAQRHGQAGLQPREAKILSAFLAGPASAMGYSLKSLSKPEALLLRLTFGLQQRLFNKIFNRSEAIVRAHADDPFPAGSP